MDQSWLWNRNVFRTRIGSYDGQPVQSLTRVVWALDSNYSYGHVPHIFLLLIILLVVIPFLWLPYTFSLLFIQTLRKFSSLKCLGWVNRLKPLFDAYIGPLNPPNHHWVGLLLLARFILLLTVVYWWLLCFLSFLMSFYSFCHDVILYWLYFVLYVLTCTCTQWFLFCVFWPHGYTVHVCMPHVCQISVCTIIRIIDVYSCEIEH